MSDEMSLFDPTADTGSVVLGTTQPRPQIVRADPTDPLSGGQSVGFIDFGGTVIPVPVNDKGHWPSVTRLCQHMGIDGEAQRKAILRKHWSKGWTSVMEVQVPGDRQRRPHFLIHEKRLPMWLANIDTTRLADPEVRANVERTQVEFADVLAEWVANGEVRPSGQALAVPQSFAEALELAAKQARAIEAQSQEIERQAAEIAELDEEAAGYRHLLEKDGTLKWANACDVLGVGPNLLGEYLRERKVTYTDVYFNNDGERREGERHNRPYADYKHWFRFAPYSESERNDRLPAWKQFDRRVTTKGVDGIRRLLRRHVFECGKCPLCGSLKKNRPDVFADYRRPPRGQHINYPKDAA